MIPTNPSRNHGRHIPTARIMVQPAFMREHGLTEISVGQSTIRLLGQQESTA